jgi:N-acetyl-alpha-D-muramate 1-phosphate uridylyltransferase
MVILAGGLGTRLRPLTSEVPKALIPIGGKPFLHHQIELLTRQGIRDIVLCVGHLAERVQDYFGDGRWLGVRIRYSEEKGSLLGTAGAVKKAEPLLGDDFFLMYGDSYLMIDYQEIMRYFRRFHKLGLMVVWKNLDRVERSNVSVEEDLVTAYNKDQKSPDMAYINYGLSVLRKEALLLIPPGRPFSQEEFYQILIDQRELLAFEVEQRFYEIGSPRGLEEFEMLIASEAVAR